MQEASLHGIGQRPARLMGPLDDLPVIAITGAVVQVSSHADWRPVGRHRRLQNARGLVDLRRDLFTLNYPGRGKDLAEAYAMATRPSPDAMKALVFIDNACRWLTPMTDAWLNANNPQRSEQLKA